MTHRIILPLLLCLNAFGQAATLTLTGPPSAKAGATIPLVLTLGGPATPRPAGLQWGIGIPAGHTVTVAPGVAGKTLSCTADNSFCLLVAANVTPIANGAVATYSLKIPSSATGLISVPLLNSLLAVDAAGINIAITSGPTYSFTVTPKQDLNSDGAVNSTDLQLMVNQVVASQSNPAACTDDLNGDGKCDLLDVFNVILKILNP